MTFFDSGLDKLSNEKIATNRNLKILVFAIFAIMVTSGSVAYSQIPDSTTCSSSKDGKISVCKVQDANSNVASQFACTSQINSMWKCVEITEKTSQDHYNMIKDALKKLMDLKSQGADAVNILR